jgi:hypothetical protein
MRADQPPPHARPLPAKLSHTWLTRLLLLLMLLLSAENVSRVGLSIRQLIDLPALPTALSPVYLALTSAAWAAAFAACLFGLARLNPWAPRTTLVVNVLYQGYLWLNRLAFGRSSEAFAVIGFRALLSAAVLGVVFGVLLWPGTRRLFAQARVYLDALKQAREKT